jgi:hypothetical protein
MKRAHWVGIGQKDPIAAFVLSRVDRLGMDANHAAGR